MNNKKSMNICHIGTIAFETKISNREKNAIGGISGYIKDLVLFSLKQHINICIIGRVFNYKKLRNFSYIKIWDKITSTNRFLILLFLKSFFIKIPKKSIIHAHRGDHLAAFIFFNRRKSVLTLHGQQAHTVNIRKGKIVRMIFHIMESFAFSKADVLIAVDEITKEFYEKLYPKYKKKLIVIPTGVNVELFKPLNRYKYREKLGFDADHKIVLYVGRVESPKKVDEIINAFNILLKEDINYRLVIVGDGVSLFDMKKLVESLKLQYFVSFLGVRKHAELSEIYNIADITILISGNEGSPLSVKESLACGIPVVASKVGDIPYIVKNGFNGYIVENENIKEIAKTMKIAVSTSPILRENCIESIQDYTIDKVSQRVINVYESLS